jgi:drug/metabolite transporter (DMT)-like permease
LRTARSRLAVYAALTAAAFFWGSGFALARFALRSISPLAMLAGQSLATALAQIVWTLARGKLAELRLSRADFFSVVGLGLVGQNILNGLTFWGLASTTATNAALLYGISPVMIGMLAAVFLREPFSRRQALGAFVGFSGVALIITQGNVAAIQLRGMMIGNLLVFGAAVYWSAYSVLTRRIAQRLQPQVYTFYLLTLGAVGPVALALGREGRLPLFGLDARTLAAVVVFGVATGTLGMNIWNWGLAQIEASRVGAFSYLEPVFAAATAMAFLGEQVTLPTAVGAALVFAGIAFSTARQRRARRAPEAVSPPGSVPDG